MVKIKVICVDNTVDCSSGTNDLILDKDEGIEFAINWMKIRFDLNK